MKMRITIELITPGEYPTDADMHRALAAVRRVTDVDDMGAGLMTPRKEANGLRWTYWVEEVKP
jgi:hypothetical protein